MEFERYTVASLAEGIPSIGKQPSERRSLTSEESLGGLLFRFRVSRRPKEVDKFFAAFFALPGCPLVFLEIFDAIKIEGMDVVVVMLPNSKALLPEFFEQLMLGTVPGRTYLYLALLDRSSGCHPKHHVTGLPIRCCEFLVDCMGLGLHALQVQSLPPRPIILGVIWDEWPRDVHDGWVLRVVGACRDERIIRERQPDKPCREFLGLGIPKRLENSFTFRPKAETIGLCHRETEQYAEAVKAPVRHEDELSRCVGMHPRHTRLRKRHFASPCLAHSGSGRIVKVPVGSPSGG